MNVGSKAGLTPKKLVDVIVKKTKLSKSNIKDVSVKKNLSFFSVPKNQNEKILSKMTGIMIGGIKITVQIDESIKR